VWTLAVKAYGDAEIGQRLQMSEDEVALAKLRMQAHIASVSHDVVDMVVNEEILAVARGGGIRRALDGALDAVRVLVSSQGIVVGADGLPLTEPDHATQLEAVRTVSTLTKNLRPNSPSVVANIQNNNSNTQNNLIGGGRSFESRRRAAAERRGAVVIAEAEEVNEDEVELEDDEVLDGDPVSAGVPLDNPDEVDDSESDEDED
jgi:hypothetical protein